MPWKDWKMEKNYQLTMRACFLGYIVQAIVNNFAPLLFLTFQEDYKIPLEQITMLITFNFGLQLLIDLLSAVFVDRVGYKRTVILAQSCAATGLFLLAVLPEVIDPFWGILTAVCIYAVGGGLCEVVLSPIVESCPTGNKEKAMSLLHSFYCWGHVGVILISTAVFAVFGIENWKIMSAIWAILPAANAVLFARAPVRSPVPSGGRSMTLKELFSCKVFWIFMLLMFAAGASEQTVAQWASVFAEQGLGVSKAVGDLAGPMFFAAAMGVSRLVYGEYGDRMDLKKYMIGSSILCAFSYLCISFSVFPWMGLVGCGICGFSVGIMWPGSYSKGAEMLPQGGTVMFALFALSGDLGCAGGPTAAGLVSGIVSGGIKIGILAGMLFPALMLVGLILFTNINKKISCKNETSF